MKANQKEDWQPKWLKNRLKINRKVNGAWVTKERPEPTQDPTKSNHQRLMERRR